MKVEAERLLFLFFWNNREDGIQHEDFFDNDSRLFRSAVKAFRLFLIWSEFWPLAFGRDVDFHSVERDPANVAPNSVYRVSDVELASRLSFFIWSSIPDEELLSLAEKNKLSLTDNLSRFFPEMNKKVADVVTVKELLTHCSGLIDHYDYTDIKQMHHAHNSDVFNAIKNKFNNDQS